MENNMLNIWLALGVILIAIDIFSFTIVLLFGGLAALTVGSFIYCNLILDTNLQGQAAVFLIAYFIWALALWKPFQKLKHSHKGQKYNDMIGTDAVVMEDVKKGNGFSVKWSGTIMKAELEESQQELALKKGDSVKIISVKGTKLTVTFNQ